jgi:transcriptional regulator with XRE-family HTH domain
VFAWLTLKVYILSVVAPLEQVYALVGRRLRDARTARRLSQEQVARVLKVARASVANFERGQQRFPLHTIYAFAQKVGLPVKDVFPSFEELSDTPAGLELVEAGGRQHHLKPQQADMVKKMIEGARS